MAQSLNTYDIGSSGIPVNSTLSGKNVNESYLALKNFSRIVLSNASPTQLPTCPCGLADIFSPLGNDVVYVGGLSPSGDAPYLNPFDQTTGRGEPIYPGTGKSFRVSDLSLLQATAARNGDTIQATAHLSQQDFTTPTNDPLPDPTNLRPLAVISTNPINSSTLVPTDTVMNMVLSRNIDPTTVILGSTVTVSPAVGGLTAYIDPQNPTQIDFDPHGANLAFTTTYTVTVTPSVKDISGTSLAAPSAFSFQTAAAPPPPDTTPPTVQSRSPGDGATGVSTSVHPTIFMSEAVQSGPVTSANIVLKNSVGQALATTVSLGADSRTITIVPNTSLAYGTKHTMSISNQKDIAGNVQTSTSTTSFTTIAATQTQRYNVAEGSTHTGSLSHSYYLQSGGNVGYGERADSSQFGQNMVGFALTKISVPHINTHGSGSLTGSLTVQIRSSTAALRYQFATSVSLTSYTGSNTPAGPIVIQDPNNTYKMVNGDVFLVVWLNPGGSNNNLQISTADNNNPPYGRAVLWNGGTGSSSYTNRNSDDLAGTIYSTP